MAKRTNRFRTSPTPGLDQVGISKLNLFIECHRKYYWRYIRNIEQKKTSIPLFVGGMYHSGLEQFYRGEKPDVILHDMDEQITEFMTNKFIDPSEMGILDYQRAVILGMLEGYFHIHKKDLKCWKILATELYVEMPLPGFEIPLVGTIDLVYKHKGKIWIGEHKTTSQVTKDYIDRLPFDLQVMIYPKMAEHALKKRAHGVCYNVIRKPSIRQRQNETFADFIVRVTEDYKTREDFYFYREEILYNQKYIKQAENDIKMISEELNMYHDFLGKKKILKADEWYRNSRACFNYGRCPFFNLCKHGDRTDQLMMFHEREPSPSEQSFLERRKAV